MSYLQESHYNINIAKHGRHHFRVLVNTETEAKTIYEELKKKYPEKCYEIDVTYWDITGHSVNFE
jgi:hypothetical protein